MAGEDDFTPFQRFMIDVYRVVEEPGRMDRILATLRDPNFDWREDDDQFLGELRCGRLTRSTLEIYTLLVDKHGYRMTTRDMHQVQAMYRYNFPPQS